MHTAEHHGFAGRFHARWRHLAVTWTWPVLISLGLHGLFLWSSPVALTTTLSSAARVEARLHAQPQSPTPPLAIPPVAANAPRPLPTAPSAMTTPPVVPTSASPLPPSVDIAGLDAGAVRVYRIALSRALAAGALRSGLAADARGTLELGVVLGGFVPEVRVLRSSGHAALDAHVLACVRAAVNAAALPLPLQGRVATLSLPVEIGEAPTGVALTAVVADR